MIYSRIRLNIAHFEMLKESSTIIVYIVPRSKNGNMTHVSERISHPWFCRLPAVQRDPLGAHLTHTSSVMEGGLLMLFINKSRTLSLPP